MRKLLVSGLVLSVLLTACDTKSPTGPEGVTPTTSTTTTTTVSPTTTTSSTTTSTVVLGSLARRYSAFAPPANVPSEMTLFFELIIPPPPVASLSMGLSTIGPVSQEVMENRYKVTGVYVMLNGTTGTVNGTLGGALNPLETGGTFTGALTAKTPAGCTAEREFSGQITPQTLSWTGGSPGTSTCSPSPLGFSDFSMLRSDPAAPLPTPPTVPSTTTTTTVQCSYSLTPSSDTVEAGGGNRTVTINTQSGCGWSAQSLVDWITIQPPFGGTGSATVTYTVAATNTARSGSLFIAGMTFTVIQNAPRPDLVPDTPVADSCTPPPPVSASAQPYSITITVRNLGSGNAPESDTRIEFDHNDLPTPTVETRDTPAIPAGNFATHTLDVPETCWVVRAQTGSGIIEDCTLTIIADHLQQITEVDEVNNSRTGTCTRVITFNGVGAATGLRF